MDVGARLKEARMAKGLSLDSLQETTKIQKRYLAAIEEGNFNILPGKFYARAFIKEYANAVGIDPNELLEEHKEEIPKSEDESEVQYTRVEKSRKESNSDQSSMIISILPRVIVVLLIIGIIVATFWFINQSSSSNEPTETGESESNVIITNPNGNNSSEGSDNSSEETDTDDVDESNADEEDTEEEPAEEMELEVVEVGTGSPPESTISLTNPGDELIFTFESETTVWLDVQNTAGETFYGGFVNSEEPSLEVDLTGEESVYLNIGSTPNLSIQINGTALEYPINPNERDHQRLWINID